MLSTRINLPTTFDPLLAEEIGLHLGDGSMNYYGGKGFYQLRGHIVDDREHYVRRVRTLYKKLFNIRVRLRDMPSTGVFGFQIWSRELVKYKHEVLGLPLGKKGNFSLPDFIVLDDKLSRCCLRGLFDTDGCLYIENKRRRPYPQIQLSSTSEKMVNQLKNILTRLGFRWSYYVERRKKYGWNDIHRMKISGMDMVVKWFSEIQPKNPKHSKKFMRLC